MIHCPPFHPSDGFATAVEVEGNCSPQPRQFASIGFLKYYCYFFFSGFEGYTLDSLDTLAAPVILRLSFTRR
jgi:hypothetical protein